MISSRLLSQQGYSVVKTCNSTDYLYEAYGTTRHDAVAILTNQLHRSAVRTLLTSLITQQMSTDANNDVVNYFLDYLHENEEFATISSQQLLSLLKEDFKKATKLLSLYLRYYAHNDTHVDIETDLSVLLALANVDYIDLHFWHMEKSSRAISPLHVTRDANLRTKPVTSFLQRRDIALELDQKTGYQIMLMGYEHSLPEDSIIHPVNLQQSSEKLRTVIKPILGRRVDANKHTQVTRSNESGLSDHAGTQEPFSIDRYLQSLIEKHDGLVVLQHNARSHFRLPIDKLYVALTVDATAHSERSTYMDELNQHLQMKWYHAQLFPAVIHHKLMHYCQQLEQQFNTLTSINWDSLLLTPGLLSSKEQVTAFTFLDSSVHEFDIQKRLQKASEGKRAPLNLAQAYHDFTHMVILGDPGSGKSTLARWLIVNMAKAFLAKTAKLEVPTYQVDPKIEHQTQETIAIGQSVRIPIFITISEYAQFCEQHTGDNSLDQFLNDKYPEDAAALNAFLKRGECLIVLDGFDETAQRENRQAITNNIHAFLDKWYVETTSHSTAQVTQSHADKGNRFLITSRIAGNYTSILRNDFVRVTIEPLDRKMVKLFFSRWFDALNVEATDKIHHQKYANFLSRLVSNDPHLNALVKTPQLATVVAHVYVLQNYQLPQSKVALYQAAIDNFTTSWRTRLNAHAITNNYFSTEFIETLLQKLAYEAHMRSGPINELLLREVFILQLTKLEMTEQQVSDYVKILLTLITEDVGLIVPYGVNAYQFIHRQFQEYLAAKNILAQLAATPETNDLLIELLSDINWHEPLRLALDCLCQTNPLMWLQLLSQILDSTGEKSVGLPLTSYMLVDLLSTANATFLQEKLGEVPLKEFLEKILLSIAHAYSCQRKNASKGLMQHTHICLAKIIASEFQPLFVMACAHLLSQQACASIVARLLLDAKYVNQKFMAPLHSTLSQQMLIDENHAVIDLLEMHHQMISDDALPEDQAYSPSIADSVQALLSSSWIKAPNHLSAFMMSTFGFQHKPSADHHKTYIAKANLLTVPCKLRKPMHPLLDYDWGDDCLYNMAIFLDTTGGREGQMWDQPEHYDPKNIFLANQAMVNLFEKGLRENFTTTELAHHIECYYQSALTMTEKTTALTALIGLGGESTHYSHLPVAESACFINHLRFLQERFKHIVYQAHFQLIKHLPALNSKTKDQPLNLAWNSFLDFYTRTTGMTFNYRYQPYSHISLASYTLIANLTGKLGEAGYEESPEVKQFITSVTAPLEWLQAFHYSPLVTLSNISGYHLPVDRLPMYLWDYHHTPTNDIPWQVLSLFLSLPRTYKFLFDKLATSIFHVMLMKTPELTAELLIIAKVLYQGQPDTQAHLATQLKKGFGLLENWLAKITQLINTIVSPYFRARAWLRLALCQGNQQAKFFNNAVAAIPDIDDIEKKAELEMLIAENCVLVLPHEQAIDTRTTLIEQALMSIRQLHHPGQKALLLTRCAILMGDFSHLILESLDALYQLEDEAQRAEHAKLLLPLWKTITQPEMTFAIKRFYEQFSNQQYAHYSAGKNSHFVEQLVALFIQQAPESQTTWIPLLASARIQDQLEQLNASTSVEQKWLNLMHDPCMDNAEILLRHTEGNFLALSLTAALALDHVQQLAIPHKERLCKLLLPILKNASAETMPILTRWLTYAQPSTLGQLFSKTALLLICEMQDCFYPVYFSEMVALLSSPFDSWRQRTAYLFRGSPEIKYPLTRAVSVFGKETYYNLVKHSNELDPKDIGTYYVLYSASAEFYQDDPGSVRDFITQLDTTDNPALATIAKCGLSNHEHASASVVNILLDQLPTLNSATQKVIIMALATYMNFDRFAPATYEVFNTTRIKLFCRLIRSLDANMVNLSSLQGVNYTEQCTFLAALLIERKQDYRVDFSDIKTHWDKKCGFNLQQLQQKNDWQIITDLRSFYSSNSLVSSYLDDEKKVFKSTAKQLIEKHVSIEMILDLVIQSFSHLFQQPKDRAIQKLCANLVAITNQLAELLPWQVGHTLEQMVQNTHPSLPSDIIKFLQTTQTTSYIKHSLVELFAHLPPSENTLEIINITTRTSHYALTLVTKIVEKISFNHHINHQLVDQLIEQLDSDSTTSAYFAAEILVKIATSELTKHDLRQHIIRHFQRVVEKVESQRFIMMTLFLATVSDIPTLASQITKGMMKITQLPDYSHDHKKQVQRLYDEANIAAIKDGDDVALSQYLQQYPEASWSDHAVCIALNYIEHHLDNKMMSSLLKSSLATKFHQMIEKIVEFDNLLFMTKLKEIHLEKYMNYDAHHGVLVLAVKKNNIKLCKFLIDQGYSVNQKNAKGMTAFDTLFIRNYEFFSANILQLFLCHQPNISALEELLEKKGHNDHEAMLASIYVKYKDGVQFQEGLLFRATQHNYPYMVNELIDLGCPINQVDEQGNNLLMIAVQKNHDTIAEILIKHGVDVNQQNVLGETPLMLAIHQNNFDLCKLITLQSNKSINAKDNQGNTALYYAASRGDDDICALLLEASADADQHNVNGELALHTACWNNHLVCAKNLVTYTSNINALTDEGATCLHLAVFQGFSLELVKLLVEHGAHLSPKIQGISLGTLAYIRDIPSQISYLNSVSVELKREDIADISPTRFIIFHAARETLLTGLDELGLDLSQPGLNGETWLIYALKQRCEKTVDILLKLLVDPRIPNHQGETAVDIAKHYYPETSHVVKQINQRIAALDVGTQVTITEISSFKQLVTSGIFTQKPTDNDSTTMTNCHAAILR